ncbi:hypothetical protein LEMLEM_LOCUS9018 [Lemmus lemmus]
MKGAHESKPRNPRVLNLQRLWHCEDRSFNQSERTKDNISDQPSGPKAY